jgi:uncharacterized membrane protein YqaE (UPF0057 family)
MEAEGEKCNTNKDCSSNICKMIYRSGNGVGRRCLMGSGGRYTKNCRFPKDCQSGICEKIYDAGGKFVAKRCIKAKPIDRDNPMDKLLGKTSSYEKGGSYGILNDHSIKVEMGEKGPVTEVIVKTISVVFDIFTAFVYNFRVPSYNLKEQGMLYSIFASVALNIFYGITNTIGIGGDGNKIPGGLISGSNKNRLTEPDSEKCTVDSRPIDMYYIRTLMTVLFPPLGVLMAKGFTGMSYILLSCLLTALFYFPGLIYSLSVINSSKHALIEKSERENGKKAAQKSKPE